MTGDLHMEGLQLIHGMLLDYTDRRSNHVAAGMLLRIMLGKFLVTDQIIRQIHVGILYLRFLL